MKKVLSFFICVVLLCSCLFSTNLSSMLVANASGTVMTNTEFVNRLVEIAIAYKTVYATGAIGQRITEDVLNNIDRWEWYNGVVDSSEGLTNRQRVSSVIGKGVYGFDCVCLIKSVLWGWNGTPGATNGGAIYPPTSVPDVTLQEIKEKYCTDYSTDFTNIMPGEYLYMSGHCGVYIGNGLAVECTPGKNSKDLRVQVTEVKNIASTSAYGRSWLGHGKLQFVEYTASTVTQNASRLCDVHYADGIIEASVYGTGTWIGVYEKNQTQYSSSIEHASEAWHYLSDGLNCKYTNVDNRFYATRARINITLDNPDNYKVVLFSDNGYTVVDEKDVFEIDTHKDYPIAGSSEDIGDGLTVDKLQYFEGEEIVVSFSGVTNKDAWIGLFPADADVTDGCISGMWCYASTGTQWRLNDSSNTVRNGTVYLEAEYRDIYTGGNPTNSYIMVGDYKIVLFGDNSLDNIIASVNISVVWW